MQSVSTYTSLMNTPAHIAASLLTWQKQTGRAAAFAVTLGAILPDAPMFLFYGFQKAVGSSEKRIWSTLYFDESWQLFFDIFNSIPLAILAMAVCYFGKNRFGLLLSSSCLLHLLCDLPVLYDDAHRHFLPVTNWRFFSPVSYWDPKHFGTVFMSIELMFAVGASVWVWKRSPNTTMQKTSAGILTLYGLVLTAVAAVWFVR